MWGFIKKLFCRHKNFTWIRYDHDTSMDRKVLKLCNDCNYVVLKFPVFWNIYNEYLKEYPHLAGEPGQMMSAQDEDKLMMALYEYTRIYRYIAVGLNS